MAKIIQDVLDTPEIRRHTQRVWDLKKKKDQAETAVGIAIADLGDELVATKAALDKTPDKTAWLRWLTDNVDFTVRVAQDYMAVAKLRKKYESGFVFFSHLGEERLYVLATMPEKIINRLAQDPRLEDPKTGQMVSIFVLSERDFKKALRLLRGKRRPKPGKGPDDLLTKEQRTLAWAADVRALAAKKDWLNSGAGPLSSGTKIVAIDSVNLARLTALHLHAWVTPQKGRRLRLAARKRR